MRKICGKKKIKRELIRGQKSGRKSKIHKVVKNVILKMKALKKLTFKGLVSNKKL